MSELLKTAIAKAKYLRDGGQPLENLCNNGDLVVVLGNELESKDKQIQALNERMKHRDDYLGSKCDGCPDCGTMGCVHPDLLTKARVEIHILKEQLARIERGDNYDLARVEKAFSLENERANKLEERLAKSEKALEISDRQHIEERSWRIALQERIGKLGDVEKQSW